LGVPSGGEKAGHSGGARAGGERQINTMGKSESKRPVLALAACQARPHDGQDESALLRPTPP